MIAPMMPIIIPTNSIFKNLLYMLLGECCQPWSQVGLSQEQKPAWPSFIVGASETPCARTRENNIPL